MTDLKRILIVSGVIVAVVVAVVIFTAPKQDDWKALEPGQVIGGSIGTAKTVSIADVTGYRQVKEFAEDSTGKMIDKGDMIEFRYVSSTVNGLQDVNGITEDIALRTNSSQAAHYQGKDGSRDGIVYKIYPDEVFNKKNNIWYELEYATTSVTKWNEATSKSTIDILSSVRSWVINTAIAQTQIFAGTGNGTLQSDNILTTWDAEHDATASNSNTTAECRAGAWNDVASVALRIRIRRCYIPENTASIIDDTYVTAVSFYGYVDNIQDQQNDGNDFAVIVSATPATDNVLANADYDQMGAVNNPTELSSRYDLTSVGTGAYLQFVFTKTGVDFIRNTAYSNMAMRVGNDALDVPVTGTNIQNLISILPVATAGTSQDPYLIVTTTPEMSISTSD